MEENNTITIYDVARVAGVSMATVSRVVNGVANVKETTRKRVLNVIEELDYRPNAIARGLASKRSTTIGIVLPSFTHSYYSRIIIGIDDVARMYNYNILIANSDGDPDKEMALIDDFAAKQVDGIIFMGDTMADSVRQRISRLRTPVILAGMIDPEEQVPAVTIDHRQATVEAVGILAKNHEKLALITGPLVNAINTERFDGFKEALEANHRAFSELQVIETKYSYKAGMKLVDRVLAMGATAAYVTDDEVAAGLLNGLLDSGVKVPEDFEIITSNNTIVTNYTRPNLTSIDQPLYDVGAVSMRFLTKLINKEEIDEKTAILPYRMAIKQSTRQ
ncbi:catabolite control protein A [Lactovum miscens]|uniref:Catabolite control protein A n=1 Tax=Lactovum miscens TaxID=190387 RepID=A0A841C8E8_9LACT|nr:catabolite control protein A [Lactovum miscens]MBB5888624.1 LacI family transcriptional regulator [Lactovum miscens]